MPRRQPSSIDKLPQEVRELIGRLRRDQGCTLDQILAKLTELDVEVSRSALGRHVKGLAEIGERMRRSREMAVALVDRFGEQPDDKLQRMNLELMHGVVMSTLTAAGAEGEDGAAGPVTFDPESVMFLARSLQSLSSAEKINADRMRRLRQEVVKKAADKVEEIGRARGISAETVREIRAGVLGTAA